MEKKENVEISKFLSYVLRHKPEAIGLELDNEGWVDIITLIDCASKKGLKLDQEIIYYIVEKDDKKRFSISSDGLRIRAAQGHSSQQVKIKYEERKPPTYLYHGTATKFLLSIREQGLNAKSRHYVHLSPDENTAFQVGLRYGKPVIIKVKALSMHKKGFKFYQADNGVWLTKFVPASLFIVME